MVMFFHGNAEIIDGQQWLLEHYHGLGVSVLLPEYRGYGRSGGTPSEKGIVQDMLKFFDQATRRKDVDASRIVFHGRSLGGAVAIAVAGHRRPSLLITEGAFRSVTSMAIRFGVPPLLVRNPFRSERRVPRLDMPMLIFHGTLDEIVPVTHGRRLRHRAKNATYVEYPCHHNELPGERHIDDYWSRIAAALIDAEIIDESDERPASLALG